MKRFRRSGLGGGREALVVLGKSPGACVLRRAPRRRPSDPALDRLAARLPIGRVQLLGVRGAAYVRQRVLQQLGEVAGK